MSVLHSPLKAALRRGTTKASVTRMWHRIEARERAPSPRVWGRALVLAASMAVVLAILAVLAWPRLPRVAARPSTGPVLQADGTTLETVRADTNDRQVLLNDGTRIVVSGGALLEPMNNSETAVVLRQLVGRVDYDITPGGPRRWTIECGPATIEVVGTSFDIDRTEARVRVSVTRGIVLVHDNTSPDCVVQLTAGMSVEVPDATATVGAAPGKAETPPAPPPPSADSAPVVPSSLPSSLQSSARGAVENSGDDGWRALAALGHNDKAYVELGPNGIAAKSVSASAEDLFTLADVARLSGHPAEAVDPLQRLVMEHATDPRAPLAALTLGRIQLRSLGMPAAAARSLDRAMELGIPGGLAEDTCALRIEALSRAGAKTRDNSRARAAYEEFVARFPKSQRSAELKAWIR